MGGKKGADIDYILPPDFEPDFNELTALGIIHFRLDDYTKETDTINGYVKTENGTILNLIFTKNEETFRKWTETTEALKMLVSTFPMLADNIKHKPSRLHLFGAIREHI